ncbi:MAG: glycosyltransferase family 4 protein [Rhodobacteraceae bacterium]|nr:glycosyltransferase family 4 protein [Paracoccaceae bacterium]
MTPPARLIDFTRTLRRAGRIPTGIDRVERAYIQALVAHDVPSFGLARTRLGYLLLDTKGLAHLTAHWDDAQLLSHARRVSISRTVPFGLKRMLRRQLPASLSYLNVGHSNITERVCTAVKAIPGARFAAFVHDVIPLEHPQFQRAETAATFERMLRLVGQHADDVLTNSQDTLDRTLGALSGWGYEPRGHVAHLGVAPVQPDPKALPNSARLDGPYFVALGTVEPRKNHAFLLDIWEELGEEAPHLVIIGARGWADQSLFDRLDALPAEGKIRVLDNLPDKAGAHVVAQASALLFPSHAEGFGLPAVEAAALGTRIIANDLPVFREVLGNIPIYASVQDRYLWIKTIKEVAKSGSTRTIEPFAPPTWEAHFKTVLSVA